MTHFMHERDLPLWRLALPYLDVRSNDEHTLISYRLGIALLRSAPSVRADIVLPAIVLHDTGWKQMPAEKLTAAIGPNAKFPELQRDHELASVEIARPILAQAGADLDSGAICDIIDGHDTTKQARSAEDAIMKDADKLWRFTAHGVATISGWFETPAKETVSMLADFVLPSFLTPEAKIMAQALLAQAEAAAWVDHFLPTERTPQ